MSAPDVDKQLVSSSYGACCISPGFFDDFYQTFVASSPLIREKFAKTDMAKQKQLLREGIGYMIMYYDGMLIAENKVKSLGASHARDRMNIEPAMYELWLSALVKTIAKHDRGFNPELEKAWRRVLLKGIDLMRSMYSTPTLAGV